VILTFEFFIGIAIGVALCTLVFAVILHSKNKRAQLAERRAMDAERLAEIGAMTSGLAHEIKNPLSSVVLNAQLLREGVIDSSLSQDESQPLIRKVDTLTRETGRLKDILEDFLSYAGRFRLDRQRRDLRELVEELSDFVHPQSQIEGVLLRLDLPPQPVQADVDSGLLKQAILNLMLNSMQAMAINPPARRELIVRVEQMPAADHHPATAAIHVIDTGPGIAQEQRQEIFRPYISSKKGGSGLGLAVARRIVEEHGGTIQLFSEVGQGSDFCISLPSGLP